MFRGCLNNKIQSVQVLWHVSYCSRTFTYNPYAPIHSPCRATALCFSIKADESMSKYISIWKLFDMTLLLSYQNVTIPSCCLVVGKKFDAFRLHIIMISVFLEKMYFLLFFLSLPLREKCPNTEFLLVRIWTPFTTCTLWILTSEIFLFHREIRKLGTTSVIKREREREKKREREGERWEHAQYFDNHIRKCN